MRTALAAIYRPRLGLPCTAIRLDGSAVRELGTTFAPMQTDIEVNVQEEWAYFDAVLCRHHNAAVRMIGLDGVGWSNSQGLLAGLDAGLGVKTATCASPR
jgi:sucrose phosphorylase